MSEIASREEWMRRTGPLYPGLVALRRLTAAPILAGADPAEDDLARAAGWATLVGALVGAVLAAVAMALVGVDASPIVAVAGVMLVGLVITTAQHERRLAATVERLAGDANDGRSRVGASGVIALLVALGFRGACLTGTDSDAWIGAIIVSQVAVPLTALLLLRIGDRIEEPMGGERGLMFGAIGWVTFGVAAGIGAITALLFGGFVGLLTLAAAGLCSFGLGLVLQRRDGGVSRDSLSAVAVTCELVVLFGFALAHPAA